MRLVVILMHGIVVSLRGINMDQIKMPLHLFAIALFGFGLNLKTTHAVQGDYLPTSDNPSHSCPSIGGYAFCSATLIGPRLLITNAHCASNMWDYFGAVDIVAVCGNTKETRMIWRASQGVDILIQAYHLM